jgi:CelD/BcsL family acetyltransferase involved in cellulose biosynthesis
MANSRSYTAAIDSRSGSVTARHTQTVRVENRLNEGAWRDFLNRHPQGNVFHTPEMHDAFSRAAGYRPSLWAAVDDYSGDVLALLTPVQVTLSNVPLHRLTSRDIAYGSLLAAPGERGEEAVVRLLDAYKRTASRYSLFSELRNLSNLAALQPALNRSGFVYEGHLDYLVDLTQPEDVVWQKMSKSARKHIRRALRQEDLTVVEASTADQLRECYSLLRMTYENARIPLADFSLFQAMFDIMRPRQMALFLVVYYQDTPIAGSVELLFKESMYGFYGGMDRRYGNLNPTELLQWHIFQWGRAHGYAQYDFGGAGRPDEEYGVRDYKAKYGGELVNFGRNVCVHAPRLLDFSKRGYSVYRRLLAGVERARAFTRQAQPRLNA